jgi:hypothetical protein
LQISVNGTIVLTAGHDRAENLTASIEILPEDRAAVVTADALASLETPSHEFLMWPTSTITLGDEICIRLVETDEPDQASIARMGEGLVDDPPPGGPICAFCGKTVYEVQTMLSGKRAYICGDCVELLHSEYVNGTSQG